TSLIVTMFSPVVATIPVVPEESQCNAPRMLRDSGCECPPALSHTPFQKAAARRGFCPPDASPAPHATPHDRVRRLTVASPAAAHTKRALPSVNRDRIQSAWKDFNMPGIRSQVRPGVGAGVCHDD